MNSQTPKQWDVFISYASEDREAVARPLATLLRKLGVSVWFDQTELKLGDSLRLKVDEGLASCRSGVVILSRCFFGKHYPERELNGLAQREIDGQNVILPVWYGINEKDVRAVSPPLADRIAVKWEHGLYVVAATVLEVVRPDIVENLRNRAESEEPLPRIRMGSELGGIIGFCDATLFLNDDPDSGEVPLIAEFLDELQDWGDIWDDIGPGGRVEANARMNDQIRELEESGWSVFGRIERRRMRLGEKTMPWEVAVVAVVKGEPKYVIQMGDSISVIREEAET